MQKPWAVLNISDLQVPFEHRDALDFIQHVDKTFIPKNYDKMVINVGDEFDQHTLGKYIADVNGRSGGDEFEEAKHRMKDWYRAYPKMKICTSNHTYRIFKKAFSVGIPKQFLKDIGEAYEAPVGWEWADHWIYNNILYEHGENVSGPTAALNAALQNRMSTVIGHQHSHGGVIWSDSKVNRMFGMNTGCLIDVETYAFHYGKTYRRKPTLGTGIILNGIPMFIPMFLDHNRRWVRRTI